MKKKGTQAVEAGHPPSPPSAAGSWESLSGHLCVSPAKQDAVQQRGARGPCKGPGPGQAAALLPDVLKEPTASRLQGCRERVHPHNGATTLAPHPGGRCRTPCTQRTSGGPHAFVRVSISREGYVNQLHSTIPCCISTQLCSPQIYN